MSKHHGTVARWVGEQAFGFIVDPTGKEYFVHKSECPRGLPLAPGTGVAFAVQPAPKGPLAIHVEVTRKAIIRSKEERYVGMGSTPGGQESLRS